MNGNDAETQAESWRHALREAARGALELAGIQGLCDDGRVELAVSAMRELPLDRSLARATAEAIREAQIQGLRQRGGLG